MPFQPASYRQKQVDGLAMRGGGGFWILDFGFWILVRGGVPFFLFFWGLIVYGFLFVDSNFDTTWIVQSSIPSFLNTSFHPGFCMYVFVVG